MISVTYLPDDVQIIYKKRILKEHIINSDIKKLKNELIIKNGNTWYPVRDELCQMAKESG